MSTTDDNLKLLTDWVTSLDERVGSLEKVHANPIELIEAAMRELQRGSASRAIIFMERARAALKG